MLTLKHQAKAWCNFKMQNIPIPPAPLAGIAAAPCCRLRYGLLNWRRRPEEAHAQFSKLQADKTGKAKSPAASQNLENWV